MSRIKLIISDLDGTLLDDQKQIPEENLRTLTEAMERGVFVTLATGRNFHSARPYVEQLDLDVPIILQNGAFVYRWSKNEILREVPLEADEALKVVKAARKYGVFYILYSGFLDERDMFVDQDYFGPFEQYLRMNSWRLNEVTDVSRVIALRESVAEIALVGPEPVVQMVLKESFGGNRGRVSIVKNSVLGGEAFYEVFGPNGSKEHALTFLLAYFGVGAEETMYVGDSFNDIGLLQLVGYPVVVENGHEEVKAYARFVTKSNNDAGVAHAVRELVLGWGS